MPAKIPVRERVRQREMVRKRHKRMFAFTNDAFFPTRRWKLSKQLLGSLAAVIAFQYLFFFAPLALAAPPDASGNNTEEFVTLPSGTPLNAEEAALVKQKLLIKEVQRQNTNETATTSSPHFAIAALPREVSAPSEAAATPLKTVTETRSLGIRTMTAYNSDPAQTDDTPCITANGFNVCEHGVEDTVAANFLPFGTKIRIPELFGERIFIVRDRMNARYENRIDVWMLKNDDARRFGVRRAMVELVLD